MSRRELALQTDIIKSVRKDKGYARKMSNRFQIGIPDLLISLPNYCPCLVEVKDLGEVTTKFDRKLDVTPKQGHELGLFDAAQDIYLGTTAFLLIGFVMHRNHYLVYLPHMARRLDSNVLSGIDAPVITRQVGNYYHIERAFMKLCVPMLTRAV